jgi:hypothetical protein
MQHIWVNDNLGNNLLIHMPKIHYHEHSSIYDQVMNHCLLCKYGYGF